jgi:excisionase family DNA binding protein
MKKQSPYNPQSIKRINDYPDILTVPEASELLGVSTKTVYKLLKEGQIEKRAVGREFKIPKINVTDYLGIKCN